MYLINPLNYHCSLEGQLRVWSYTFVVINWVKLFKTFCGDASVQELRGNVKKLKSDLRVRS